jgi:hypothetical protein
MDRYVGAPNFLARRFKMCHQIAHKRRCLDGFTGKVKKKGQLEVNYGCEFAAWASLRQLETSLHHIHAARNLRSAQVHACHVDPALNLRGYVAESLAQFTDPLGSVQTLFRGQSVQGRRSYSFHQNYAKLGAHSLDPLGKPFD